MSLVVFTAFVGLVARARRHQSGHRRHRHPLHRRRRRRLGRAQHVVRRRHRRRDEPHRQPPDPGRPRRAASEALAFGLVLSVLLGRDARRLRSTGWPPALLAFTIFFYAVVYTMWLKRSTPQNIVIGGAAGAFPPMIGWAAVTGDVSASRASCCSSSSSCGRRRISGRWRSSRRSDYGARRRPDDAQRRRRGVDQAPDPRLFARAAPCRRRCPPFIGFAGVGLRHRRGRCSASASSGMPGRSGACPTATAPMRAGQGAVRLFAPLSVRASSPLYLADCVALCACSCGGA